MLVRLRERSDRNGLRAPEAEFGNYKKSYAGPLERNKWEKQTVDFRAATRMRKQRNLNTLPNRPCPHEVRLFREISKKNANENAN